MVYIPTIPRHIANILNENEVEENAIDNLNAPDIDVGSISNRASQISLFDFKAFLNSESAIFPIFPTVSYFI